MEHLHVVITLFNLKFYDRDKRNTAVGTPLWLKKRLALFDKYCFPSVVAQSCKDFVWLVLLDAGTDTETRALMADYAARCPNMRLHYLTAAEALAYTKTDTPTGRSLLHDIIAGMATGGERLIATSNLDNDDALHRDYASRVAAFLRSRHARTGNDAPQAELLSFPYGYQYFPGKEILLRMRYPHNHFLTLVERADSNYLGIVSYPHTRARKQLPNTDVCCEPLWMEVVHDSNVNNDLRITSRIAYAPRLRSFSFKGFGRDASVPAWRNVLNLFGPIPLLLLRTAISRLRKKLWKQREQA
ncbi:MAG: hypothetical protein J6M53_02565 [Bacteroidaceae bacterium]|nr:hypothetical protein [Bacteroidaceae bacterium]